MSGRGGVPPNRILQTSRSIKSDAVQNALARVMFCCNVRARASCVCVRVRVRVSTSCGTHAPNP